MATREAIAEFRALVLAAFASGRIGVSEAASCLGVTRPEFYALVQRFAPEQAARIIFMTGAAFSSADWAFLETTAHPTLRKPFVLQAVRDVVRVVVG